MPVDKIRSHGSGDEIDTSDIGYRATTPTDWTSEPHDVGVALDELRGLSREYHVVFFTSAEGVSFDATGFT